MYKRTLAALLTSAALVSAIPAGAQEVLAFGTSNPDQHPLVTRIFTPWVEAINADSPGDLQVEFRNGNTIVSANNYYDRVMDDVVQIVWGMTVFDPGRFPRALVGTLPFIVPNSEVGSVALCRMWEQGAFDAEMGAIVPLLFVEFPQAAVHLKSTPIDDLSDIAGHRVMSGNAVAAGIIQAYGGTPLSVPIYEQYEALQRNTADGTMINFTAFPAFRLNEQTNHHFVIPLGGALGMVFMARDRFDALSPEAQAVLQRHSGCDASRVVAQRVDEWENGAMQMVASQPGHTLTIATPEQIAELEARVGANVEAGFAARVPGGAELIRMFRAELAAAQN